MKVALALSFTGPDAPAAQRIANGAQMAIDAANRSRLVKGHVLQLERFDDGTAAAGGHDPAQGAANARRMAADRAMLAAIGPMTSSVARAMVPILAEAGLPIVSPAATGSDLTDPSHAARFRPAGKPVFFRTVATDAAQGAGLANFYAEVLKVKKLYVLDDAGVFGVGIADAFEAQARTKGIEVLGRERLDPKADEYSAVLNRIRSLAADAIYYGGTSAVGAKLARQAHEIIPAVIKGGGDGIWGAEFLTAGGFPAVEGWYATQASPELVDDPALADWTRQYVERFKSQPDNFAITAHGAAEAIVEAARTVAATGKPVTREALRDALQSVRIKTAQGMVEFDANGDIRSGAVSVYQVRKDAAKPLEDPLSHYRYVAAAPAQP